MSADNDKVIRRATELKAGVEAGLDKRGEWLRGGQANLVRLHELERPQDQGPIH